jgi:hypothetical protein
MPQVFYAPLISILDDKALTVIFANIEDILLTATSFMSSLEQRQRASRLYVDTISDVLIDHVSAFSIYTVGLASDCMVEGRERMADS